MRDPTEGEALVAAGRKCRTDQCCDVYASSSKKAAALYTQAGDYQKTARFYYKKAEDTYYQANNWASYDDWRRARDQWDYFYSRNR
jgi:hypothetical protein